MARERAPALAAAVAAAALATWRPSPTAVALFALEVGTAAELEAPAEQVLCSQVELRLVLELGPANCLGQSERQ